jgi:hypothetical protein
VQITNEYEAEDGIYRGINSGNYVYCLGQKLLSSDVGDVSHTDASKQCTDISEDLNPEGMNENCGTKGIHRRWFHMQLRL